MTSAIFAPRLAQSTLMAVCSSIGTSIVSLFIRVFDLNLAICSRASDERSSLLLLYFMIYEFTMNFGFCQEEFRRKTVCNGQRSALLLKECVW